MSLEPLPAFVRQRIVPDLLAMNAENHAEKVALISNNDQGDIRRLTYEEMYRDSSRLAAALADRGVRKGDRVGILLDNYNAIEAHLTYHASHRIGAINVPLNTSYNPTQMEYVLKFAGIKAVVFGLQHAQILRDIRTLIPTAVFLETSPQPLFGESFWDAIACVQPIRQVSIDESEDADWLFTSGTTGNPKSVALTHASSVACAYQSQQVFQLFSESILQSSSPFYTSTGTHTNLLGCLAAGCTYFVEPQFDARKTMERVAEYHSTNLWLLSGLIYLILERVDLNQIDLSSLKCLSYGGMAMPRSFYERIDDLFATRRGVTLAHFYGLTEGGTSGIYLPPELHSASIEKVGPYGLTIGNRGFYDWVKFRVADEDENDVKPGEVGEICLRGPSTMDRYVNDPESTRATLRNGWLHTGDMGTIDEDGFVYFVDRLKQLIRRGGLNISSGEVEAVLLQFPGILEAAAIPKPNIVLGEEVKAVVALDLNCNVTPEEIIDFCREHLASYKVPVEIEFVERLPRNSMGKVLKKELCSRPDMT